MWIAHPSGASCVSLEKVSMRSAGWSDDVEVYVLRGETVYECRCERKKKVTAAEEEDVIFQSAGGSVYHTRSDCQGLGKAKAEPKRMCLYCQRAKAKLD